MPIVILSRRHAASTFRRIRESYGLTRTEVGRRLYTTSKTIANREIGDRGMSAETLLATAEVFGFDIALIPKTRRRATGTGWPT